MTTEQLKDLIRSVGYTTQAQSLEIAQAVAAALKEKQEPVAWRTFDGEGGYDYRSYDDNENYAEEWAKRNPKHIGWVEPLYTHPDPVNQALQTITDFDQMREATEVLARRIAELEAALDVALEKVCGAKLCEVNSMSSRREMLRLLEEVIAKIKEVRREDHS